MMIIAVINRKERKQPSPPNPLLHLQLTRTTTATCKKKQKKQELRPEWMLRKQLKMLENTSLRYIIFGG
jgi:hypothetical protein